MMNFVFVSNRLDSGGSSFLAIFQGNDAVIFHNGFLFWNFPLERSTSTRILISQKKTNNTRSGITQEVISITATASTKWLREVSTFCTSSSEERVTFSTALATESFAPDSASFAFCQKPEISVVCWDCPVIC